MAVNLTPSLAAGLGAAPTDKAHLRAWLDAIVAAINSDLDPRATPIYATRAAAIAAVPSLPASLSHIMVREGTALVIRSRTASADDPLFDTGARWGVVQRQDMVAGVAGRPVQLTAADPGGYTVPSGITTIITETADWFMVWRRSGDQQSPASATRALTENNGYWVRLARYPKDALVQPILEAVQEVQAPALRRSTDAQSRVHELMDLGGGLHLPGLRGLSVQEHVLRLYQRIAESAQVLPYQTVVNAVSDLGCDPTGKDSCEGIINAAINRLTASTSGPATIFYPRGTYKLTERIVPKSRVSHIGAGRDQTIFLPFGIRAAFTRSGSPTDYLENCVFAHFTVDGANQVLNGGKYDVGTKGAFFQGFRLCLFTDLRFVDTGATSLGIDFADRSIIQRVLCERGGRLAAPGDPGASGIGIGTGWLQSEPLIIADCISLDCRNYGVFVERQRDAGVQYDARHNVFANLICRGNGHAFGEAGCAGSIVTGGQFTDSVKSGVALHRGTLANGPHPGVRTLIRDSVIERNGGAGIEFDGTQTFGPRGYSSDGNRIEGNAGPGHWIRGGSAGVVDDFAIRGDEIIGNADHGIHVESGSFTNFDIVGPRLLRNTGSGIRLDAAIRGGRIHGATIRDLQAVPTQTGSITGAGALTDFDIDGVQGVGCAPISLTGAQTRVTFGRNPGV